MYIPNLGHLAICIRYIMTMKYIIVTFNTYKDQETCGGGVMYAGCESAYPSQNHFKFKGY